MLNTKVRFGLLAAIAISLLSPAMAAVQKRTIAHEDVWLAKRLSGPVVSPDGRWVAVQVTEPAYDEKDQVSDLWIVPADGSAPPRRLTSTKAAESGAAWSQDSRRIAFSTRRDGDDATQIYVIDVGGGEAQRATTVSTGARTPQWRPDGTAILFVSDVYPGAGTEEENKKAAAARRERKWNARVYDSFPIRDWDRWLDERRPTLMVQPLESGASAKDILAGTRLAAAPGFAGQWGSGSDAISATWSRDGQSVVFAATRNRHESAFAEAVQSLWVLHVGGEPEPHRMTADADSYARPAFSPDGKTLYGLVEPGTDRVYNMNRLVSWSWRSAGSPTTLTKAFDRPVGSFVPGPDGRTVYFLAEEHGRQKLFTWRDSVRELGTLTQGTFGALAVGGTPAAPVIVATWESAVNPPELVRIDATTGERTRLSSFNADRAAEIDAQPLQEFWFTSARGARIHNFVALPPGFDQSRKYPLLVLLHGGPHSAWIDQFVIRWNYHLLARPGYVVLLTNYTGSTGFGEKFAQAIQGDPLDGPAQEVNQAADEAIKRYPFIDATRQAAGGASYGGHLANWLAVTTTRYKALVSHAGLFDQAQQWGTSDTIWGRERNAGGPPWENADVWTKQNPLARAGQLKTPMLVTVGERDYRVPMNNAIQLWSALQRMKVPSRLIVFPEENHWVMRGENSRFFYSEVHAWLARWLAGGSTGERPPSGAASGTATDRR